jgi:hypothetical protein
MGVDVYWVEVSELSFVDLSMQKEGRVEGWRGEW